MPTKDTFKVSSMNRLTDDLKTERSRARDLSAENRALREALGDLLDALTRGDLFREIEAGCDGEGPVVRGYRALGDDLPEVVREYVADGLEDAPDDEDEDDDDEV